MKVLIADGSALIRNRLVDSLKDCKDMVVIGRARNGIRTVASSFIIAKLAGGARMFASSPDLPCKLADA